MSSPLDLIQSISLRSAYTPSIDIDLDSQSASSDSGFPIDQLKPAVIVNWKGNLGQTVIAPYGMPPPSKWPTIQFALTAGGVVVGALLVHSVVALLLPRKR